MPPIPGTRAARCWNSRVGVCPRRLRGHGFPPKAGHTIAVLLVLPSSRPLLVFSLFLLCLSARPASAAVPGDGEYADDVETGTLGRWDANVTGPSGMSGSALAAAAHRGNFGIRMTDSRSDNPKGFGPFARLNNVGAGGNAVRVRYWMRIARSAGPLRTEMASLVLATSADLYAMELRYDNQLQTMLVSGHNKDDTYSDKAGSVTALQDGSTWYLVEGVLLGLGTKNGIRRLYVNGALDAEQTGIDFTGMTLSEARLGQPVYSNGTWQGQFDFDDFRTSRSPLASRFRVQLPALSTTSQCQPMVSRSSVRRTQRRHDRRRTN